MVVWWNFHRQAKVETFQCVFSSNWAVCDWPSAVLVLWGRRWSWITLQVWCDRDTETLTADQALPVGLAFGIRTQLLLGNNSTGPANIWLHVCLPSTRHTSWSRQADQGAEGHWTSVRRESLLALAIHFMEFWAQLNGLVVVPMERCSCKWGWEVSEGVQTRRCSCLLLQTQSTIGGRAGVAL